MKILIAEDNEVSRIMLSSGLQKRGYEVVETADGEEAWQRMQEADPPQLLLLDIMMPFMDGLEICKKIRSYYTWTQPYIIILTARTDEDDIVHGLQEVGADDYVVKPYSFRELNARILVGKRILDMQSSLLAEVTKRKDAQKRLYQLNQEHERVFHGTQDAMFLVSAEGEESFRFMRNNKAHQTLTGISLETIRNKTPEELLGEELGRKIAWNYAECVKAGQPVSYEETLHLPGGKKTLSTTLNPVFENSKVQYIVGSSQDITERKQMEKVLQESEERFRIILENLPGAVFTHDLEGRFLLVNMLACRQTGYSREELLQMKVEDIDPQASAHEDILNIWQKLKPGHSFKVETTQTRKDGSQYPAEVLVNAITMDGQPAMLAVAFDISERKAAEESLRFLATTDELTGLCNRRHFIMAVRNELERAHRYQKIFSLLMLDIDYFKKINDTYGHGGGDEILRHFAHLIRKSFRQIDIPGRVGGEEFSIILPHTDLDGAYAIAERFRQCIENTPTIYQGNRIYFTVSIGAASYREYIKSEDEIFRMADNALYKAKSRGRNLVATYNDQSSESS